MLKRKDIIVVILFGSIGIFLGLEWSRLVSLLNNNSGAVQGISNIALVCIAAMYSYFTWCTVEELRNTRLAEFVPILRIDISPHSEGKCALGVTNLGKGTAFNIDIVLPYGEHIHITERDTRGYFTMPVNTNQFGNVSSKVGTFESDLKIHAMYDDALGRKYESEIPIRYIRSTRERSDEYYSPPGPQRGSGIIQPHW